MMKSVMERQTKLEGLKLFPTSHSEDIIIDNRPFTCESCVCQEFIQVSDGNTPFGMPVKPFSYSRAINTDKAYLIDRGGRYWVAKPIFTLVSAKEFVEYVNYNEDECSNFDGLNKVRGDLPLFCKKTCRIVKDVVNNRDK